MPHHSSGSTASPASLAPSTSSVSPTQLGASLLGANTSTHSSTGSGSGVSGSGCGAAMKKEFGPCRKGCSKAIGLLVFHSVMISCYALKSVISAMFLPIDYLLFSLLGGKNLLVKSPLISNAAKNTNVESHSDDAQKNSLPYLNVHVSLSSIVLFICSSAVYAASVYCAYTDNKKTTPDKVSLLLGPSILFLSLFIARHLLYKYTHGRYCDPGFPNPSMFRFYEGFLGYVPLIICYTAFYCSLHAYDDALSLRDALLGVASLLLSTMNLTHHFIKNFKYFSFSAKSELVGMLSRNGSGQGSGEDDSYVSIAEHYQNFKRTTYDRVSQRPFQIFAVMLIALTIFQIMHAASSKDLKWQVSLAVLCVLELLTDRFQFDPLKTCGIFAGWSKSFKLSWCCLNPSSPPSAKAKQQRESRL